MFHIEFVVWRSLQEGESISCIYRVRKNGWRTRLIKRHEDQEEPPDS